MITEFIFTVGLPGCGKSTYLTEHYHNVFDYDEWHKHVMLSQASSPKFGDYCQALLKDGEDCENCVIQVAADDLKPFLDGYTDEHPETVHEDSVQLAKDLVLKLAQSKTFSGKVVMDGGGINNHYTSDIIKSIKETNSETVVTCLFFDTPIEVCLERLNNRPRKVPVDAVYEKNMKLVSCIIRYIPIVDNFVRVSYFTNKYILLDMDGTIAAYGKVKRDADDNADFVNGELFLHLRPVNHVIDFIKDNCDMKNVYIVTACANSIAWDEKNQWLDKYFPEIPKENRYFCGNKDYKHVFVKHLAIRNKWKLNDVCLIDDYHNTIDKCKHIGINCLHPSNVEALIDKYAFFS